MPDTFLPDDLARYERLRDLEASPVDGTVACVIETPCTATDSYRSAIWLYTPHDGAHRQLTSGEARDTSPRWSPDGQQIAFVSSRADRGLQLYSISPTGGEARQLCNFELGVVEHAWSPDGKTLAVLASMDNTPASLSGEPNPDGVDVEVISRLPYKLDGLGYTLRETIHLFVVDVSTGKSRQLTSGYFEVRDMAWAPDGKKIYISRTRDTRLAHRTDLWSVDTVSGDMRQLTDSVGMAQTPRPAPDGKTIVFDGSEHDGDAQIRLWRYACDTGSVSSLGDEDIEVVDGTSMTWDADGTGLTFLLARRGLQEVAHIDLETGAYRQKVGGSWHISDFRVLKSGSIAFQAETPTMTNQLFVQDPDQSEPRRLSHLNGWWQEAEAPRYTLRAFNVPDGEGGTEDVDGWVITPRTAGKPGPLLLDIHGGPASYALLAYTSHPYWPLLVEKGWTILALNAVGSSSYGREFAARLRSRWGDLDLEQHLAAADTLTREGVCNGKLAVTGKSYGGYAAAWAITRDRHFDAAVILAPVTNLETHYGTSDSGYYADAYELDGTPSEGDGDENRVPYARNSPSRYAGRVKTPTLLLQGKDDQRCPLSQAEDFFVRLFTGGDVPAEMALYPGASHHFLETGKPSQRVDVVRRMLTWLERWTSGQT